MSEAQIALGLEDTLINLKKEARLKRARESWLVPQLISPLL